MSQRNLTVSTCGLVPEILALSEEKLQLTLAISLHAPNDRIRQQLMPIARRYSIEELLLACRTYFEKTGRRITFEYSLVSGINDSDADAVELAQKLRGLNCHVNLIPVNPVRERDMIRPDRHRVGNFKNKLENYQINVTIRRGQLRKRYAADIAEREFWT